MRHHHVSSHTNCHRKLFWRRQKQAHGTRHTSSRSMMMMMMKKIFYLFIETMCYAICDMFFCKCFFIGSGLIANLMRKPVACQSWTMDTHSKQRTTIATENFSKKKKCFITNFIAISSYFTFMSLVIVFCVSHFM